MPYALLFVWGSIQSKHELIKAGLSATILQRLPTILACMIIGLAAPMLGQLVQQTRTQDTGADTNPPLTQWTIVEPPKQTCTVLHVGTSGTNEQNRFCSSPSKQTKASKLLCLCHPRPAKSMRVIGRLTK